ncbi:MAG: bifunctional 2-polyprenyl-6-hydroxyphenol methylase/3-demethylubiquinol 3-O-methyltransferase UbiG [Alphaproteobacteria bacterium]|nr:bifunctional 2-polyprenyl-6-hydroxyphenol methylase/3-demethylubiquinol 3-O-methyltransferase UbiG [Alphaproteobacteria bacterium]
MMDKTTEKPLPQRVREAVLGGPEATVDAGEIAKFEAMAEEWWDPDGKFKPLHRFNPVRLTYIRDRVCTHFSRDSQTNRPLAGLRVVDVGCGGGLLAEPLARLGASVTGIDAAERNVVVAQTHARQVGLEIDYRFAVAETLAEAGEQFDVVLNMEVVEHVADVEGFLAATSALVAPGGVQIIATLNRTAKSYALAIIGAEYVLRWLPRGTHDWRKFLRPAEVTGALERAGLTIDEQIGVTMNPLTFQWSLNPGDLAVNYMVRASRPAA